MTKEIDIAPLFKDVLLAFDQEPFRPLLENEIYNLIQKQIPEGYGELSPIEKAELIAFRFIEPSKNRNINTATYFKPLTVTKNEDGTDNEFPSVAMITQDIISYWKARLEQVRHPVLATRYAGLIYDFSFRVTSSKAHYTIAKKYIESLLNLVKQKLYKVPVYAIGKASRALEVSLLMNDAACIEMCKAMILSLENEIAVEDKPGLWGFSYDLLIAGKRKLVSAAEEAGIIQKLEDRFQYMLLKDSWCSECAATRLLTYYHRLKRPEETKRILKQLESSYAFATAGLSIMQQVHYVEKMYNFYKQFQLNEEAEITLKKLRDLSAEADKEMKSIAAEINVSKEDLDKYVDQILQGNSTEIVFAKIIKANTPGIEDAKQELSNLSKKAPLQFILTRDLLDKKGRRVAKIGPLSEDMEGHLAIHISNSIRIGTFFLHLIFEEAEKREIFTTHEVMKFLRKSCIIESERFTVIQKGLDAYFAGEYAVAMHLLIPQFEEAIRNLVELNGGSVMIQKDEFYNLKTFDHVLTDPIVTDVFGEDMALYFRILFTDRRGWNIRHNIAHGMLDTPQFNKQNTDRILHALLSVGMVRLKEERT